MPLPDPVFKPAAKLADVPPGKMKGVEVDGTPVLLANVEGKIYAIKDQCTHQFVPLSDGSIQGCVVTCRKHAWQYNVKTGEYYMNPRLKVKTYEVKIEGDQILVCVPYEGYLT